MTGTNNNGFETPQDVASRLASDLENTRIGSNTDEARRNLFGSASTSKDALIASVPSSGMMPDKFDGKGFKTWQQKMHYYLATMHLEKYLTEDKPTVPPGNTDVHVLASVEAWIHADYLCKGQILGRLVDDLFDLYSKEKTSKSLWLALEHKYRSDESGQQRFSTAKFLNFRMVDSKPIMEQVEALQRICQEIELEGMSICDTFTANCLIEKLPPSWAAFKHYLSFKRKAMTLEALIRRLRIEDNNRITHGDAQIQEHDVNVAEHKSKMKGKGKQIPNQKKPFLKASSTTKLQEEQICCEVQREVQPLW